MVEEYLRHLNSAGAPSLTPELRTTGKMTNLIHKVRNSQNISANRYFQTSKKMQNEIELKRLSVNSIGSIASIRIPKKKIMIKSPKFKSPKSPESIPQNCILFTSKKIV